MQSTHDIDLDSKNSEVVVHGMGEASESEQELHIPQEILDKLYSRGSPGGLRYLVLGATERKVVRDEREGDRAVVPILSDTTLRMGYFTHCDQVSDWFDSRLELLTKEGWDMSKRSAGFYEGRRGSQVTGVHFRMPYLYLPSEKLVEVISQIETPSAGVPDEIMDYALY